jgi:hypothetical protein
MDSKDGITKRKKLLEGPGQVGNMNSVEDGTDLNA